jgi:hypothetical protein
MSWPDFSWALDHRDFPNPLHPILIGWLGTLLPLTWPQRRPAPDPHGGRPISDQPPGVLVTTYLHRIALPKAETRMKPAERV